MDEGRMKGAYLIGSRSVKSTLQLLVVGRKHRTTSLPLVHHRPQVGVLVVLLDDGRMRLRKLGGPRSELGVLDSKRLAHEQKLGTQRLQLLLNGRAGLAGGGGGGGRGFEDGGPLGLLDSFSLHRRVGHWLVSTIGRRHF
jgi:hypothetical protein